jgi:hypothetical protein
MHFLSIWCLLPLFQHYRAIEAQACMKSAVIWLITNVSRIKKRQKAVRHCKPLHWNGARLDGCSSIGSLLLGFYLAVIKISMAGPSVALMSCLWPPMLPFSVIPWALAHQKQHSFGRDKAHTAIICLFLRCTHGLKLLKPTKGNVIQSTSLIYWGFHCTETVPVAFSVGIGLGCVKFQQSGTTF